MPGRGFPRGEGGRYCGLVMEDTPGPAASARAGAALLSRLPLLIEAWRTGRKSSARPSQAPRAPLSPGELEKVAAALLRLQRGLTSERKLAGAGYLDDPDLLGAYLLYYWPVSYLQASLSLEVLASRLPRRPLRIFDLGSGPGPVSMAFADHLEGRGPGESGKVELHLVDGSEAALALAERLFAMADHPARTTRIDFEDETPPSIEDRPYDALVASHLLNELWKGEPDRVERRLAFIEARAEALAPDGLLLLIEPALEATSRDLLALRDGLARKGWRLLAPCTHSLPCPVLAAGRNRSCHGEAAWDPPEPVATLARLAGLDRDSVKWTWFGALPPNLSGGGSSGEHAPDAGARRREGNSGDLARARVVSEGMLNKAGRLRYLLCHEGGLATLSSKAGSPLSRGLGFEALRRHDLVAIADAELREGGLGLVEGSSLEIIESYPRLEAGRGRTS